MTFVILGKVLEAENGILKVLDISDEKVRTLVVPIEKTPLEGTSGAFIGTVVGSELRCLMVEARKFLDPIFEDGLLTESGKANLFKLINDPFPAYFKEFYESVDEQPTDIPSGTVQEGEQLVGSQDGVLSGGVVEVLQLPVSGEEESSKHEELPSKVRTGAGKAEDGTADSSVDSN